MAVVPVSVAAMGRRNPLAWVVSMSYEYDDTDEVLLTKADLEQRGGIINAAGKEVDIDQCEIHVVVFEVEFDTSLYVALRVEVPLSAGGLWKIDGVSERVELGVGTHRFAVADADPKMAKVSEIGGFTALIIPVPQRRRIR